MKLSLLTLQFLKNEFPTLEESYLQLLYSGIVNLTKSPFNDKTESQLDRYISAIDESWHFHFKHRETYFREILKLWPTVLLFQTEEQLKSVKSFDEYLEVYRKSRFGVFLANTKMLTSIYSDLKQDWGMCFSSWITGSSRILYPYSGLSIEVVQHGIRQVINEVILHTDKYHNEPEEFKRLIKRYYQLMLTEQNR